jgi:hypothetical protein
MEVVSEQHRAHSQSARSSIGSLGGGRGRGVGESVLRRDRRRQISEDGQRLVELIRVVDVGTDRTIAVVEARGWRRAGIS